MFRFTIRDLLLAMTVLSVLLAWFVNFPRMATVIARYCHYLGQQMDEIAGPAMARSDVPPE
jgi:hypothetical protein